jgi:penicillin-binding protein 1A
MDAWFAGWQPTLTAVVWIGYDQPRKLGDRETGGGLALPVWIEYMQHALKGVPVQETTAPEGLVQNGSGEWVFEEYGQGASVGSVGLEDKPAVLPPQSPNEEEKKSILDLFKR